MTIWKGIGPWGGVSRFTWTGKPTASSYPIGQPVFITDVGGWNGSTYSGSYWFSDGTLWRPVSGRLTLSHSAVAVTIPAGGGTATFVTQTIPGGLMGPNGMLLVTAHTTSSSSANTRGVAVLLDGTVISTYSTTSTGINGVRGQACIANRNSESAQHTGPGTFHVSFGSSLGFGSTSVATGTDFTVAIQGTAASDAAVVLQDWLVELIK